MSNPDYEFDPVCREFRATTAGYYWVQGAIRQLKADEGIPVGHVMAFETMVYAKNRDEAWHKALEMAPRALRFTAADLWWAEEMRVLKETAYGA
jgi:hypothetical protein